MTTLAQDFGFTSDQMQALTSQGFDLVDVGDLDGAVNVFTGLVTLNSEDACLHAALGSVFHEQGKLSEALAAYDTAISIDGDAVLARVNRGELRCKRNDLGGLEDLQIAARIASPVQARAQSMLRLYAR